MLIVVALFMATARVIANVQNPDQPGNKIEVVAIGHQFWWEYRYPSLGVVTANELHVPVSDLQRTRRRRSSNCSRPIPTTVSGCRAWRARLDLIPRHHPNNM